MHTREWILIIERMDIKIMDDKNKNRENLKDRDGNLKAERTEDKVKKIKIEKSTKHEKNISEAKKPQSSSKGSSQGSSESGSKSSSQGSPESGSKSSSQGNSQRGSKKKKRNNKYDIERVVLYAVSVILLALVISLAIKNYSLESKLDKLTKSDAVATGASENKENADNGTSGKKDVAKTGGNSEKTDPDSTDGSTMKGGSSTEIAEPLAVQGDVQYIDIEVPQAEEKENYNGEDLADNGYPYAIKINRQENIVTVYALDDSGFYTVPVRVMRCSVSPVGETPIGIFNIALKWEWLALFDNCYGQYVSQIDGDTLFHSVPYLDTTKDSLETWEFNKLGTGASLGCVRLCVADTKWIYENCESGTYVDIFDSDYYGPLGRPVPVTKLQNTEEQGWDPTDMVEENPTTGKAVIYGVESHSIKQGENYDTMAGVMAFNSEREDVTDQLKVEGSVDNTKAGKYTVKYSFNDQGQEVSKNIVITVEDDEAPVITKVPVELKVENYKGQKEELAQLVASYISAQDGKNIIGKAIATDGNGHRLDGSDISKLNEDVICVSVNDISEAAGTYSVVCSARDASGNISQNHTVKVTIVK